MVVCRYFLEGRCHFGQNCRYEHIYGNNRGGRSGDNTGNRDLNTIVWQISQEVEAAEKAGQWPLTSFAPLDQRPGLPGWEDISPEEVRWTFYEAQKNGAVNQALNQISQWYKNAEKARNLVKQRAPEVVNLISEIINGNQPSHGRRNAFSSSMQDAKSSFRFDTAVTNIFNKPTQTQNSGNVFGGSSSVFQSQNVFGSMPSQSTTPGDSTNIFGQPQQQQQQQKQQQSNQNIFTGGVSGGQNIFSNNTGGVFGQGFSSPNTTNQNMFQSMPGTNIFQSSASAFGGTNTFGGSSNIFGSGQNNAFQQSNQSGDFNSPFKTENVGFGNVNAVKEVDSSVYSKIEDLNENEINSFTSTTFTFGNIPLKPPPQQYC